MKTVKSSQFVFARNSFDIIRYWAAISVMIGHFIWKARPYYGADGKLMDIIGICSGFFPGVVIFFTLSGFLLTASYARKQDPVLFVKKRIARIYPELWACTVFNIFVMVVICGQQFNRSLAQWMVTQLLGIANTPDSLKSFGAGSVNGSLWTIFVQMQLSVFLVIAFPVIKRLNFKEWIAVLLLCVCLNIGCEYYSDQLPYFLSKLIERSILPYLLWFMLGVFLYSYGEQIVPFLSKYIWVFFVIYLIKYIFIPDYGYYSGALTGILVPLITVGLAYALPPIRIKMTLPVVSFCTTG